MKSQPCHSSGQTKWHALYPHCNHSEEVSGHSSALCGLWFLFAPEPQISVVELTADTLFKSLHKCVQVGPSVQPGLEFVNLLTYWGCSFWIWEHWSNFSLFQDITWKFLMSQRHSRHELLYSCSCFCEVEFVLFSMMSLGMLDKSIVIHFPPLSKSFAHVIASRVNGVTSKMPFLQTVELKRSASWIKTFTLI